MPPEWTGFYARAMVISRMEAGHDAMVGGDPARFAAEARTRISRAFLELHIEQGPVLETAHLDIGVVTAIAGITRIEVVVSGPGRSCRDNADGQPRLDALSAAAARLVTRYRGAWVRSSLSDGPGHFAATVGEFEIEPNAANVVPSQG